MRYLVCDIDEEVIERFRVRIPLDDEVMELAASEGLDADDPYDQATLAQYVMIHGLDYIELGRDQVKTRYRDVYVIHGIEEANE